MNFAGSLSRTAVRGKLVVLFFAACFAVSSGTTLAQATGDGTSSSTAPAINNPSGHNVSTGNYIPPPPPSGPNVYYNHRWDLYAGAGYNYFLAGPRLLEHSHLGGWEGSATYWLGWHWGVAADARQYIGTSGVFPNANGGMYNPTCKPYSQSCYNNPTVTGPRIMQYYFMAGPEYRMFRRARASATAHVMAGEAWGIFDAANLHGLDPRTIGLFATQWTPAVAVGGTVDFNYTPRIAIRIQPEMLNTHYGGTAQQNFAFSTGLLFRVGHLNTEGSETPAGRRGPHFHNPFRR